MNLVSERISTGRPNNVGHASSIACTRHSPASVTTIRSAPCRAIARATSPLKLPLLSGSSSFT
jgi:hypothetical protein